MPSSRTMPRLGSSSVWRCPARALRAGALPLTSLRKKGATKASWSPTCSGRSGDRPTTVHRNLAANVRGRSGARQVSRAVRLRCEGRDGPDTAILAPMFCAGWAFGPVLGRCDCGATLHPRRSDRHLPGSHRHGGALQRGSRPPPGPAERSGRAWLAAPTCRRQPTRVSRATARPATLRRAPGPSPARPTTSRRCGGSGGGGGLRLRSRTCGRGRWLVRS
jgi:hypothetical protein